MVIQKQFEIGEGLTMPIDPQYTPTILQPSSQPQKTQKPRKPKRKDTQIPQSSATTNNVADEAVHKELGDSLVRAATIASSLEAEQDSGNITKTRSKETPNASSSQGTNSGGGLGFQETIGDTTAQTRFESISKLSNDSLLARGNTLQSDEDRLKLEELMALCTTLQNRVLDLEKTKTTQHNEIASLKRRVKKLEKRNRSKTHKLKRLYKVGLSVRVESSRDEESLGGEEVFVVGQNDEVVDAAQVKTATITTEEITLAQALEALKTSKPKVKGIVIQEPGTTTISSKQSQDKDYKLNLMKKKDLQERDEKEQEANIALIETWDDIQAKIETDHELAQRLQAEDAEEKRNKPPTQAQQRKIMCTYLKNIEGKKPKDLKNKSFDSIQKMFDKAFKRVNTFVDYRNELVEESSKKAETELEENLKKVVLIPMNRSLTP
ncbi:hypothetical protein Tco_0805622 [Tanacetum coccineum]